MTALRINRQQRQAGTCMVSFIDVDKIVTCMYMCANKYAYVQICMYAYISIYVYMHIYIDISEFKNFVILDLRTLPLPYLHSLNINIFLSPIFIYSYLTIIFIETLKIRKSKFEKFHFVHRIM